MFSYNFSDNYSDDLTLADTKVHGKRIKEYKLCSCGKHVRLVNAFIKTRDTRCQICTQKEHIQKLEDAGFEVIDRLDHLRYVVLLGCGHYKTGGVTTLIGSKHYCKECTDLSIVNRFGNFGVKVLELGNPNVLLEFPCGHTAYRKTYSKDKPTCMICEEESKRKFLLKYAIDQLDSDNYKLKCGHIVKTQNYKKLDDYKCPACKESEISERVKQYGMEYTGNKNSKHEREIILPCGHVKFLRYKNIKKDVTCTVCENTHYSHPCDLYVLLANCGDFQFVKVGVAKVLEDRVKEYRAKGVPGWFNIFNIGFVDKYTAIKHEKDFHIEFKDKRIDPEIMKKYMKEGFTECYPASILEEILSYLRPLYNTYGGSIKFK